MTDKERIAYLEYALAEREKELAKAYQSGAYVMKCEILNRIHSVAYSTLCGFFEDLLKDCYAGEYWFNDLMTEDEFLETERESA